MIPSVTEKYNTLESDWVATISAQGLRNGLVKTPKPPGTYRILALGDSFAYGWGVNAQDVWEHQLQESLRQNGIPAEIINAGAPGITFRGEWRACQTYARRFQVDAVLASSFVFDDLYQAAQIEQNLSPWAKFGWFFWPNLANGTKQILVDQWYRVPPGSIVSSKEKWGAFTRAQMIIHPDWYAGLDPLVFDALKAGEINPIFFGPVSGDQDYLVKLLDPDHLLYALAAAQTWLSRLKSCAGARPLYVVTIPSATMVSKDFFPYRHALKFTLSDALLSVNVDAFMKPLVISVGGRYIGLTDMFRQSRCTDCYFLWDRHLTPLGNRMVADTLVPIMAELVRARPR